MESTSLAGRSILIVEDEPLIAWHISSAFEKVGAVVLEAQSLPVAANLVEKGDLSAAIIDFGLGYRDAGALCAMLNTRQIPFVLHSGYAHASDAGHGGLVTPKPADPALLVKAIGGLLAS